MHTKSTRPRAVIWYRDSALSNVSLRFEARERWHRIRWLGHTIEGYFLAQIIRIAVLFDHEG